MGLNWSMMVCLMFTRNKKLSTCSFMNKCSLVQFNDFPLNFSFCKHKFVNL